MRNVLDTSLQNNIRTICLGSELIRPSKSYPVITAITIIIRTLRRCLEKLKDKFDKIVICLQDKELYDKFRENLKMYFPRNKEEEQFYAKYLPVIQETEYGDIIIPERHLNIKSKFNSNDIQIEKREYKDNTTNTLTENAFPSSIEHYYLDENDDIKNYKM
jgi:predicted transport protein